MRRILLFAGVAATVGLVGVLVVAATLAHSYSTDVLIITPAASEAIALNKMLWEEGDDVAEIYGVPSGEVQSIIFAQAARIIRPVEDPSLVLYRVTKEEGENPLQEKTVWYFARLASLVLGVVGGISFVGYAVLRRRPLLS